MELVIKIPDKYKELLDHGKADGSIRKSILNTVANGTPLPKGHGRLIDADAFIENEECCGYIEDMDIDTFNLVTPTIIEADKEQD